MQRALQLHLEFKWDLYVDSMAREITEFSPRLRKTTYPYHEWFNGKINALDQGEDFDLSVSAKSVASTLRTYANRHHFAAVVIPVRGAWGDDDFRSIEVWGDPNRPIHKGLPKHISDQLREQ